MSEVVNVLVAFAVVVLFVRWATTPSTPDPIARALGFRPKNVTPQMLDQVTAVFPDIPRDNIKFDLLKTGSVEHTTNKILERGFLDAPPPGYYTAYPRQTDQPAVAATAPATGLKSSSEPNPSLIERYGLKERASSSTLTEGDDAGKGAKWEDTAEKREASLRERKAKMVLAARQRFLAQQQQDTAS